MLSVWTNCFARRRGIRLKCGQGAGHHNTPGHTTRWSQECWWRVCVDRLLMYYLPLALRLLLSVQCTISCPQVKIIIRALHMMCHIFWSISLSWCEMFYCLWQQTTLSCHVIKFTDWKGSSAGSMWRGSAWSLMSLVFSNFDIDLFAPSLVESAYYNAIINLVSPPEICP